MQLRNYYKLLEISPFASTMEIKKAYRKLAKRFHPDNNIDNPTATEQFQDIQEAYEVLSNSFLRKNYDAKLNRQSNFNAFGKNIVFTVEDIVKQSAELKVFVQSQKQKSINNDALTDFVLALLSIEHIELLNRANDEEPIKNIIENILFSTKCIVSIRLFRQIYEQLSRVVLDSHIILHQKLELEMTERLRIEQKNRLVPIITFLIVLLVIFFMWLIL